MKQKIKLKSFNTKLKEECGVFGVSNIIDASALTALGLHALQHRGQEGCGIVSFDGKKYHSEKRFGLVGDNFNKENASLIESESIKAKAHSSEEFILKASGIKTRRLIDKKIH